MSLTSPLCEHAGIEVPLICGAMYPCSNAELIAAVSRAGALGMIQPMSMEFVFRTPLREGIRAIRAQTDRPIGLNLIVEKAAKVYEDRVKAWLDVALDEGIRFFVTALGNPRFVVDRVHAAGGVVYHDVTNRKWALKALDADVDGLICVNARAGGHAGQLTPEALLEDLSDLGVPLVCAGGIGSPESFVRAIQMGYAGCQLGTRFIATEECQVHPDYKQAILRAHEEDIVLTEKISGVPVAVIRTPYIDRVGTKAGPLARRLLRHRRAKRFMRMYYSLLSVWQLRQASLQGMTYKDYFQAGKSVEEIHRIMPAGEVVRTFADALAAARA